MGSILTEQAVPKYIRRIVQRLHPVLMEYTDEEGNWWGYTFRLDAKWRCGYEGQLEADAKKLVEWSKRWYAHAKLIRCAYWSTDVPIEPESDRGCARHRRKALQDGWRNHAFLVITDPVANRFEKDGFYRKPGASQKPS